MRGYVIPNESTEDSVGRLNDWEAQAVDAVGTVIEFWGFKRNHGRVWALAYLRDHPLSADELQSELGLSKGAVNTITRELERWRVLTRVRVAGSRAWRFRAEQDLLAMVTYVFENRELELITRVREDLARAEERAKLDPSALPKHLDRLARMRRLAELTESGVRAFLDTAQLDARALVGALRDRIKKLRPKLKKDKRR